MVLRFRVWGLVPVLVLCSGAWGIAGVVARRVIANLEITALDLILKPSTQR